MNVLIYRYGSICEPDIIKSLEKAGITVITENAEITNKRLLSSERIELVDARIKESNPVFVFSINFFPDIAKLCNIYGLKYVFWTVDSPVIELFDEAICLDTNRGFLFDRAQYEAVAHANPKHLYHLPLAAATDRFDKVVLSITDDDRRKYSSDISFVGSLYTEYDKIAALTDIPDSIRGYVDGITVAAMQVYGSYIVPQVLNQNVIREIVRHSSINKENKIADIDEYIASHQYISYHLAAKERVETLNELAKYYKVDLYTGSDVSVLDGVHTHGRIDSLTEMPKVFNLSKINLNMTIRSIETGLPLRCFDIMGCGGFLMTNYQDELADMFEIGVDLECYSSVDELIDKCNYYLKNEDVRKKIAQNGCDKVAAEHTYYHRLMEMLRKVVYV